MTLLEDVKEGIKRRQEKALYDIHPELVDRIPLLRMSSEDEQATLGGMATYILNANEYTAHIWVHKALKVIADNVVSLPVYVAKGRDRETDYLEDHPISQVLNSPNDEMSGPDLWREWIYSMFLGGDSLIELTPNIGGKLAELWHRDSSEVKVRAKKGGRRYRKVDHYRIEDGAGDPFKLTPEQATFFKFLNPLQPFRGIAPLTAARLSIRTDREIAMTQLRFARNNMRPDFAVIAPEGITKTEKKDYLAEMRDQLAGTNQGMPLVMEDGVADIKQFSWAPKDIEWAEQRKFSRDEIGGLLGVPDEIMGYGRDTYENFDTALTVLWLITLIPLTDFRDVKLSHDFKRKGLIAPDERIATDIRGVEVLKRSLFESAQVYERLLRSAVPPNEINQVLDMGFSKLPEGDTAFISSSLIPVEDAVAGDMGDNGLFPHVPPREGRPELTWHRVELKGEAYQVYGSEDHALLWKDQQERLNNYVGRWRRWLKRSLQDIQNDVNASLREFADDDKGAKGEDDYPSVEQVYNADQVRADLVNRYGKRAEQVVSFVASDELEGLGVGISFDITLPTVRAAIREVLENFSTKLSDRLYTEMIPIFDDNQGAGIAALQEALADLFIELKADRNTERIARTTLTGFSNLASREAWDQSGVVEGRDWISALKPGRTRSAHREAHGQRVKLKEAFTVGGESLDYPGDPKGSPGNIIHCLCTTVAVLDMREDDPVEPAGEE